MSSPPARALDVAASSVPADSMSDVPASTSVPAAAAASSLCSPASDSTLGSALKKAKLGAAVPTALPDANQETSSLKGADGHKRTRQAEVASASSAQPSNLLIGGLYFVAMAEYNYPMLLPPELSASSSAASPSASPPTDRAWKSLSPSFRWTGLAPFTVLVGINGCGKTAILESFLLAWRVRYLHSYMNVKSATTQALRSLASANLPRFLNIAAMGADASGLRPGDMADMRCKVGDARASESASNRHIHGLERELWVACKQFSDSGGTLVPFMRTDESDCRIGALSSEALSYWDSLALYRIELLKSVEESDEEFDEESCRILFLDAFRARLESRAHVHALATVRKATSELVQKLQKQHENQTKAEAAVIELNAYLTKNGFPHTITPEWFDNRHRLGLGVITFGAMNESAKAIPGKDQIPTAQFAKLTERDLSSGERIQLLCLLWRHSAMHTAPGLLLLDEPDAHLHPSLCQEFIQSVQQLVKPRDGASPIQVIMTTHNATTVRFLCESDEEESGQLKIFKMVRNASSPVEISKRAAMQFLSQSLVSVCEPLRIVFCEAPNDVDFYDALFRRFLTIPNCLHQSETILMFKSGLGKTPGEQKGAAAVASAGSSNSNRNQVKGMMAQFSGDGKGIPVTEFVRGIIDHDNLAENSNRDAKEGLVSGRRYAIENYIYDPLIIARMLFRSARDSPMMYAPAWNLCIAGLSAIERTVLTTVLELEDGAMPPAGSESVLQKLIDNMSRWFINTLNKQTGKIQEQLKKITAPPHQTVLVNATDRSKLHPVMITAWSITLQYPALLLAMVAADLKSTWWRALDTALTAGADHAKAMLMLNMEVIRPVAQQHLQPFDDLVKMFTDLQTPIPAL